jgi:hypothetical protein
MLGDDPFGDGVDGADEGGVVPGRYGQPEAPVRCGHAI